MMNPNARAYRTCSYRLYPTQEQKLQLNELFDRQDRAFNEWAEIANNGIRHHLSEAEIRNAICSHVVPSDRREERYALSATRNQVLVLLSRLCAGQMERVQPRRRDRKQKKLVYKTAGVSEFHLALPSIGTIAMKQHRPFPDQAVLCYVNVFSDSYGASYHVDFVLSVPVAAADPVPVHYNKVVGLDYAQDGLFVTDTGENGNYPGFRRQALEDLEKLYRTAERFRPGSCRWRKFRKRAAKLEQHIVNQRRDWQYKKAHELAEKYDAVCMETLDLARMKRENPALAPKVNDNAFAAFSQKLCQALTALGKQLIHVDRYFPSSQICSCCGKNIGKQPLDQEFIQCPFCGASLRRNHNAARNIRQEGYRMIEQSHNST